MEQKNKGGRPTKTLSEKRKYQVLLRLNTMEYYTLLGKAREASIPRTVFLRLLITNAEVKSRIKPEEMQLIRTVSGMANNLNQIAHRLNAFGISALNEELNVLKQLIHELMKRLKPCYPRLLKEQISAELSVICLANAKVKSRFYKLMACAVLYQMTLHTTSTCKPLCVQVYRNQFVILYFHSQHMIQNNRQMT